MSVQRLQHHNAALPLAEDDPILSNSVSLISGLADEVIDKSSAIPPSDSSVWEFRPSWGLPNPPLLMMKASSGPLLLIGGLVKRLTGTEKKPRTGERLPDETPDSSHFGRDNGEQVSSSDSYSVRDNGEQVYSGRDNGEQVSLLSATIDRDLVDQRGVLSSSTEMTLSSYGSSSVSAPVTRKSCKNGEQPSSGSSSVSAPVTCKSRKNGEHSLLKARPSLMSGEQSSSTVEIQALPARKSRPQSTF